LDSLDWVASDLGTAVSDIRKCVQSLNTALNLIASSGVASIHVGARNRSGDALGRVDVSGIGKDASIIGASILIITILSTSRGGAHRGTQVGGGNKASCGVTIISSTGTVRSNGLDGRSATSFTTILEPIASV